MNALTLLLWAAATLSVVLSVVGLLLVVASGRASHVEARVRALLRQAWAAAELPGPRG